MKLPICCSLKFVNLIYIEAIEWEWEAEEEKKIYTNRMAYLRCSAKYYFQKKIIFFDDLSMSLTPSSYFVPRRCFDLTRQEAARKSKFNG